MAPPTFEELLKSTPQLSRTDIEYLQEWLSKQPHFPPLEDVDLVPVLTRSDFSVERTKDLLDKYLTMRTHAHEAFGFRDVTLPVNKEQFKYFHAIKLGKDAKGNQIVCMGYETQDLSNFNPEICTYLAYAFMELAVREEPTSPGYIFILNAGNLTTTHLTKIPISLTKKILTFLQEAIPLKLVSAHVIHLNPVVDKLMLLIKPFLSREMQQKMHFHAKNLDAIYELFPKDSLPQDYGGTLPKAADIFREQTEDLVKNVEWLKTVDKRVVDESRRPGRPKGEGDVFGVDGTFKKLDFD